MRVLVSGASGLVGAALAAHLRACGDTVVGLARRPAPPAPERILWEPAAGELAAESQEGFDAVVHLAGASIAARRWSAARRAELRASRLVGTRLLCHRLGQLRHKPGVLASASAVGYYGDRGAVELDEAAPRGRGFLATLAGEWEEAAAAAAQCGMRVVRLRFGVVLSARGGALARQLPLFRWGLGGRLGSGDQYLSWIAVDDAVAAIRQTLLQPALAGPVNVVAPQPVTNAAFTAALAGILRRPARLHVPAWVLRLLLGALADEALLASIRAVPRRLLETSFRFGYPELEGALRHVLGASAAA